LANHPGETLNIGVTNDLGCVFEHREGLGGDTKRYAINMPVYFMRHNTAIAAIQREKNITHWSREWKIDLIISINPNCRDLYAVSFFEQVDPQATPAGEEDRWIIAGSARVYFAR
jgi:putative endonuclease